MFSDRFRAIKFAAAAILLGLLVIYAADRGPRIFPGYYEAIHNPDKFSGQKIYFGGKIIKLGEGGLILRLDEQEVFARGSVPGARLRQRINGTAIFNPDYSLTLGDFHVYPLAKLKVIVAILPLALAVLLLFRNRRFDVRRMTFRKRT
jgi:hypothetical protein